MPVFRLSDRLVFPSPNLARYDGLLCVGGDLTPERLVLAYQNGIFPWFSPGDPLLWWSPDPRLVILPGRLKISRSLQKKINRKVYTITMDQAFGRVIKASSAPAVGGRPKVNTREKMAIPARIAARRSETVTIRADLGISASSSR